MLEAIRKRKNSPILLFVLGLALLAMAAFGMRDQGPGAGGPREAATVNGEVIEDAVYSRIYAREFAGRQEQDRSYDRARAEKDQLRERVLNNLITEKRLAQIAKKHNFAVDDEALRDFILAEEAFQTNGVFDKALYERVLNANQMTHAQFEESERERRLAGLYRTLASRVSISDEEIKEAFEQERKRIVLSAVRIDKAPFEAQIGTVTPADAEEWSKTPEAEEKIKKYYTRFKSTRYDVPEQVCAQHILVRSAKQMPPDVVAEKKEQIKKALEAVKGGMSFDEAAQKFSEDSNKDVGGDLGCFSAGETLPPIEQEAFKLKPGEVSGVFESGHGFHVLKVKERKEPIRRKLEDVRQEIALELVRTEKASLLAKAKAEEILARAKELGSLDKALSPTPKTAPSAGKKGAAAAKSAATGATGSGGALDSMYQVETTQPFPQGRDFIPPLGVVPEIASAAWQLTQEKPLADTPFDTERAWVLIALKERQEPSPDEYEEAKVMLTWRLASQKISAVYEGWTESVRRTGDVEINPYAVAYSDEQRARFRGERN